MYRYRHKFWIANEGLLPVVDLRNYELAISEAIDHYNDVSERARNPKRILEYKVSEKYIVLTSESSEPLARPNLALQVFSSYLANGKMEELVKNKALFRGEASEENSDEETTGRLSEDELLLEIIRIFRRSTSLENKRKIEAIRKIVCQ